MFMSLNFNSVGLKYAEQGYLIPDIHWDTTALLNRVHAAEMCLSLPQGKLAMDDDSSTTADLIIIM